jgi:hypothetical protein
VSGGPPFQLLVWQDFDDFWRELESRHADTPYTFDAYDEEVARIAFRAGRESMRQQVVALLERMMEVREHGRSREGEVGRAVLREIADDMTVLARVSEN